MSSYSNQLESCRDEQEMLRWSILGDGDEQADERGLSEHKRSGYTERVFDIADDIRKTRRENAA